MDIGIFTFAKKHGRPIEKCGSSMIRGQWLVDHWPEAELYREGKKYDVVIFQKVWWEEMYMSLREQSPDTIVILDLCDPEWITAWKSGWDICRISTLVDAIVVSSQGLYDEIIKFVQNVPVVWIDDRVNLDYVRGLKKQHNGHAKQVGWFGYQGNGYKALEQVMPSIERHDLDLLIIAENKIEFDDYRDRMKYREHSWQSLPFDLMSCDIILNPPIIDPLAKYKSKNKTYLSWSLGIPVAHNGEELKQFIDDEARKKESDRVYELVRTDYDIKKSVEEYKKLIQKLWETKQK